VAPWVQAYVDAIELEMDGHDATEAHKELTRLEATQRLHSEHRDALLRKLRTLNG
jgi:hypothetical protein